jgi:hypothetical protein
MRLFLYFLFLFVLSQDAFPQTILYDKEEIELDSFTQKQLGDLNDSLLGEWKLVGLESYFKDDTCDSKLLFTLVDKWYHPLSLVFNEPYKCLVKYMDPVARQEVFSDCTYTIEIMPFDGLAFFYLKFESTHIPAVFGNPISWNGCLTDFTNSAFV